FRWNDSRTTSGPDFESFTSTTIECSKPSPNRHSIENSCNPFHAISRGPPRIPFHCSTPPSTYFSPMISASEYPLDIPCRKRNASRRLLFPEAFVPTRTVNLPSFRSAPLKFLKFVNFNDRIMTFVPLACTWPTLRASARSAGRLQNLPVTSYHAA